ncbi:addiction module protein [Geitlerinema splendidum]|nr:addiction module protein [Geitlerinema splendidum]
MSLQELKEQAFKLSVSDRLDLVNYIIESLQNDLNYKLDSSEQKVLEKVREKPLDLIGRMQGFLKTDKPAPIDTEVQAMLEERLEFDTDPTVQTAWTTEAKKRRDEIRKGSVEVIPGDEALGQVKRLLENRD